MRAYPRRGESMRVLLISALVALALPVLALAASRSMSPVVSAKLKGSNEAPVKGDPNGSGLVVLHLSTTKRTACWQFSRVARIDKPTQAHIHKGRKGRSGPVVIPLGASYKVKGCAKASRSLIEAIETNPNRYYVNIHTVKYPGGAIRGSLVVGMTG
jgi:CHRD domain-containing protein